jgi:flagellar motor switch protein FliG
MRGDGKEGASRAAALLIGLGPEAAAEVLKRLPEDAVKALAQGARALKTSRDDAIPRALDAFLEAFDGFEQARGMSELAFREILERALGETAAARTLSGEPPIDAALAAQVRPLVDAEPADLALLLTSEAPQTAALVISVLPERHAAQVIEHLPDAQRGAVIARLSTVRSIAPDVLDEVLGSLTAQLSAQDLGARKQLDGAQRAVGILRAIPSVVQRAALADIERSDPQLAETLANQLLTFDDVARLSTRDVQTFLRTCDLRTLALALRGASPEAAANIFGSMSKRAARSVEEEIEGAGLVRASEVTAARADLVKILVALADEGRITLNDEVL